MNYTTTLLVFALLSRLIFCSTPGYRAVCATEYSSVLKRFYDSATYFHHCLQTRNSGKEFMKCLENKEKAKEHYHKIPIELKSDSKSNTELLDSIHKSVCDGLNRNAELLELPKDIAFDKYDVLNDSENIKNLFRTLRIGIKIKIRSKNVLKKMIDATKLLTKHSKKIKQCLYTRKSNGDVDFDNCLSSIEEGKLLDYVYDFPRFVMSNFCGYDANDINDMDDIDLIIELNKFLNFIYRRLIKEGEIVHSAQDRINEQVEYDTGNLEDQFDWIIKATGMFGVVIIIALLVYCIRGKHENDEELDNNV